MASAVRTHRLSELPTDTGSLEELRESIKNLPIEEGSGEITDENEKKIQEAVDTVSKEQGRLTPEQKLLLVSDLVTMDYNEGVTKLQSDIETARRNRPAVLKLLWMVLDAVLIKEGLRVIRDQPIQEYTKVEKTRRKTPTWRRWLRNKLLDEQEKTAQLLQEAIQLAADNDCEKRRFTDLKARNDVLDREMSLKIQTAQHEAARIINQAQDRATQLNKSIMGTERKLMNLKNLEEQLLKNPVLANMANHADISVLEKYKAQIYRHCTVLSSFSRSVNPEDYISALEEVLGFFHTKFIALLKEVESEVGPDARVLCVKYALDCLPNFAIYIRNRYTVLDQMVFRTFLEALISHESSWDCLTTIISDVLLRAKANPPPAHKFSNLILNDFEARVIEIRRDFILSVDEFVRKSHSTSR